MNLFRENLFTKNKTFNKVLIIVAHPDDAEISMGMRIYDYAKSGYRVYVHCISKGGKKGNEYKEIRVKEAKNAGKILGVYDYTFSDIPDGLFEQNRNAIREEIKYLLGKLTPETIYTHFPFDFHSDHKVLSEEVLAVVKKGINLSFFRSPHSKYFTTQFLFLGDKNLMHKKIQAIKCFASQKIMNRKWLKEFFGEVSLDLYVEYINSANSNIENIKFIKPLYIELFNIHK